jgi:hypothetical protein
MEYVVGSIGPDGCLGRTFKVNSWEEAEKAFFHICSENRESLEQGLWEFFENNSQWTSPKTKIVYFVGGLEDF